MSAVPRLHSTIVALFALSLVSCVTHRQRDGRYAFIAEEVARDDCGILGPSPELSGGTLHISGDVVTLDYDLFGIQLRGQFREVSERFFLDGTASDVTATVGNEACHIDLVQVHIDGTTESPEAFSGTLIIRYDVLTHERCRCEMSVRFRAELTPSAPK